MLSWMAALDATRCVACDAVDDMLDATDARVCLACDSQLPSRLERLPQAPACCGGAWTLGDYAGLPGQLVRIAKYGRDEATGTMLAERLARAAAPLAGLYDSIVPVPSHPFRTWLRGSALPAVLAHATSVTLGVPRVDALARVGFRAQASRSRRERAEGGAVTWRARTRVAGRVLLVDDVLTSGSTADGCAAVLLQAGAARVDLLVVAAARGRLLAA
jgi:predicted amidophosphoribosyltransferase